jgi:hypothetical protein
MKWASIASGVLKAGAIPPRDRGYAGEGGEGAA